MSDRHFWLSEAQFARIRPLLPDTVRGVPRADDRRMISAFSMSCAAGLDVARRARRIRPAQGAPRPLRALERGPRLFNRIFACLATEGEATGMVMSDAAHLNAHRTASSRLKKGHFRAVSGAPAAASGIETGFSG